MANAVEPTGRAARALREPLLHFVVLGALLFGLDIWLAKPETDERRLILTAQARSTLRQGFTQREGRQPTPAEESELVAGWAKQEALYREALRLGLDQSDPIVRDRLVQKMRGVEEGLAVVREPTEAELSEWLKQNLTRYESPLRFDLEHHFVSKQHADAERRADALLAKLTAGASVEGLTDAFYAGARHDRRSVVYLERTFGKAFAASVQASTPGIWTKAMSDHGWHVLRLAKRAGGEPPTVGALRGILVRDWQAAERRRVVEEKLDALVRDYRVVTP